MVVLQICVVGIRTTCMTLSAYLSNLFDGSVYKKEVEPTINLNYPAPRMSLGTWDQVQCHIQLGTVKWLDVNIL